jgi:hypothetical protein
MDQRILQLQFRIEHEHADGSWGQLVEERPHHDPASHDEERRWTGRRIFRCSSCGETVALTAATATAAPDAE